MPFRNHPLIQQYNEIKRYFRKFETKISQSRIKSFYHFSRMIQKLDYDVAFDFVGSLNFGVTDKHSDVDLIIYLDCKKHINEDCEAVFCNYLQEIKFLLETQLLKEFSRDFYEIQIVDCINLVKLDYELEKENPDIDLIFRFAFYRSICRGVNLKILKPYHQKLLKRKDLLKKSSIYIEEIFKKFNENTKHILSFEKYRIRLTENGIKIPYSVIEKIKNHMYTI